MWKEVKAAEKISAILEKPKYRNSDKKKKKKHLIKTDTMEPQDINYVEELKTQLTYGDTGHGILLDKKV